MKGRKRKILAMLMALGLLLTALTPALATGGAAPVEVTIWGAWSGERMDAFVALVEQFNQANPGIHATYVMQEALPQKLVTALASGDVPDMVLEDRFLASSFAQKGALLPLDEYVKRDGIDLGVFYDETIKEMTYDGQLYGLPLLVDNRALFYNKEHFREAGLDPERPPQTWDELAEYAKKLTVWEGDNLVRSGFALNDVGLFNTWILQAGGDMLTEDGTKTAFNGEAGMTVLKFWDKLMKEDKVYTLGFMEKNSEKGENPFIVGKVSMLWNGPWAFGNYGKYADSLDYGVAVLPAGPNGDRGARMGGFGASIAAKAKHPDEAWELLKWWAVNVDNNREISKITNNVPANKLAAEGFAEYMNEPHYQGIIDNMEYARIRPTAAGYSMVEGDCVTPNLQLFMSGQMTAEQALSDAQAKGDQVLAEEQAP